MGHQNTFVNCMIRKFIPLSHTNRSISFMVSPSPNVLTTPLSFSGKLVCHILPILLSFPGKPVYHFIENTFEFL